MNENDHAGVRFHGSLASIDGLAWDALLPDDNPFVSHAFLSALESEGCIRAGNGWAPHHLTLRDGGGLVGAVPLYLKGNSHGEFVFDWAWADAWQRTGRRYYPKLLAAVPYSPVGGARLLVGHAVDASRRRIDLAHRLRETTLGLGLSSAHVNFTDADDGEALLADGWLAREDHQFHWHNRGWPDFDAFLDALTSKKRKNIRQERRQVAESGTACTMRRGDEVADADWPIIHRLYADTFDAHGNLPVLTEGFLRRLAKTMPKQLLVCECRQRGTLVAMALFLRSNDTLYGRYWGADNNLPGLHFEACYYQGIDYCLREGLARFEPGAQGEHKIARGFLPTPTRSFHFIANEGFRHAVADYLQRETAARHGYRDELMAHSPYRDSLPG